jgi:hypothetical protein
MVYIRVTLSEKTNRIINEIKKEYGFKNKGQVINYVAEQLEKKYHFSQEKIYKKKPRKKGYRSNSNEKERK